MLLEIEALSYSYRSQADIKVLDKITISLMQFL